jgi:hypothetical protein
MLAVGASFQQDSHNTETFAHLIACVWCGVALLQVSAGSTAKQKAASRLLVPHSHEILVSDGLPTICVCDVCCFLLQVRARLAAKKKAAETKKKSLAAVAAAEAKARAKKASKKDPTKFNQAPTR